MLGSLKPGVHHSFRVPFLFLPVKSRIIQANQPPETGIAKAEKRFGVCTDVRSLHPIAAIQKRNIPLNCRCKFGVIARVSSSQGAVRDLQVYLRVGCHPPKKRRHVLNGVRTNDRNSV
jgi:hypothetical protein